MFQKSSFEISDYNDVKRNRVCKQLKVVACNDIAVLDVA